MLDINVFDILQILTEVSHNQNLKSKKKTKKNGSYKSNVANFMICKNESIYFFFQRTGSYNICSEEIRTLCDL